MARSRNIKPSFFDNDKLADGNCPLGRLLFIGLWGIADYNGNLEYRPRRIKKQLLAYDECSIEKLMINLEQSGFITSYSYDMENIFVNIGTFLKHQNPHPNEKKNKSEIPIMDKSCNMNLLKKTPDLSRDDHVNDVTDPSSSLFPSPSSLSPHPKNIKSVQETPDIPYYGEILLEEFKKLGPSVVVVPRQIKKAEVKKLNKKVNELTPILNEGDSLNFALRRSIQQLKVAGVANPSNSNWKPDIGWFLADQTFSRSPINRIEKYYIDAISGLTSTGSTVPKQLSWDEYQAKKAREANDVQGY